MNDAKRKARRIKSARLSASATVYHVLNSGRPSVKGEVFGKPSHLPGGYRKSVAGQGRQQDPLPGTGAQNRPSTTMTVSFHPDNVGGTTHILHCQIWIHRRKEGDTIPLGRPTTSLPLRQECINTTVIDQIQIQ
jgi:hypothetical protein